ncbi:MAG: DUF3616 domain-containing protein, partial [Verrucomicrobiaceae bacterium]
KGDKLVFLQQGFGLSSAISCDEENQLYLVAADGAGEPKPLLKKNELIPFLGIKPKKDGTYRETDLEGAARIDDLVYWIGSHGTNSEGEERMERKVLFATKISGSGGETSVSLYGNPCTILLDALKKIKDPGLDKDSKIAPAKGGLNIESLCARPDGTLLIGFRSPAIKKRALLIPLTNPLDVIKKKGTAPALGAPILLDLEGRGVRDMAPWGNQFLILGGDYRDLDAGGLPTALYLWSGDAQAEPKRLHIFDTDGLNPEAIFHQGASPDDFRILSDDGIKNGIASFRSLSVTLSH